MRKIIILFILFISATNCRTNPVSEADRQKAEKLNSEAVQLFLEMDTLKAKELYTQAKNLDPYNWTYRGNLINMYVEEKKFDKAFELVDELNEEQKNSVIYYQLKGSIHDKKGELDKAKSSYKKALTKYEDIEVETEMDLNNLIGYTTIQTLAGQKEKAVDKVNETLNLAWLTKQNIEYLETFRNEFEYYQGGGYKEFDFTRDIEICTKNIDSLQSFLKKNHINTSGSNWTTGQYSGSIFVAKKFKSGLENLGIEECEKNASQQNL